LNLIFLINECNKKIGREFIAGQLNDDDTEDVVNGMERIRKFMFDIRAARNAKQFIKKQEKYVAKEWIPPPQKQYASSKKKQTTHKLKKEPNSFIEINHQTLEITH